MRTVHETEALRPSDPIPKSMHGGATGKSKLKIIIKTPQSQLGLDDSLEEPIEGDDPYAELYTSLSKDLFTSEELSMPTDKLYRKCHFENKWASEESETLKKECNEWEEIYHKEWVEKEALLTQVIQSEVAWNYRRQAILSGAADVQVSGPVEKVDEDATDAEGDIHTIENGLRPIPAVMG